LPELSAAGTNEAQPAATAVAGTIPRTSPRNVAIDAYRGLVMLLMMAEILEFSHVARAFPGNWFWQILAYNQSHVEWAGFSLHDLIQPSFSFLVGVALPYSIASRLRRGGEFKSLFGHALWRAFLLVALGIILRSLHHRQVYFTFEDTLTQIGLGYPLLFLLGFRSRRWQWGALALILGGYWLAWALYPIGTPPDWSHNFSGFAAHWNKTANLGNAFDQWFLNLFPRSRPFVANDGGYLTLSFIPTLGTMILGLAAGRWLRDRAPDVPLRRLLAAGAVCLAAGMLLHYTGICPIVKRIWTPAWTLFSGGICFWFLAAFSWVTEVKGAKRWAFPLVVIGMNSIAAYLIAQGGEDSSVGRALRYLGSGLHLSSSPFEPLILGGSVLLLYWLLLWWMYEKRVFLKI
jgi:heparan-alpha-glucosaminide N-acetyltransferase